MFKIFSSIFYNDCLNFFKFFKKSANLLRRNKFKSFLFFFFKKIFLIFFKIFVLFYVLWLFRITALLNNFPGFFSLIFLENLNCKLFFLNRFFVISLKTFLDFINLNVNKTFLFYFVKCSIYLGHYIKLNSFSSFIIQLVLPGFFIYYLSYFFHNKMRKIHMTSIAVLKKKKNIISKVLFLFFKLTIFFHGSWGITFIFLSFFYFFIYFFFFKSTWYFFYFYFYFFLTYLIFSSILFIIIFLFNSYFFKVYMSLINNVIDHVKIFLFLWLFFFFNVLFLFYVYKFFALNFNKNLFLIFIPFFFFNFFFFFSNDIFEKSTLTFTKFSTLKSDIQELKIPKNFKKRIINPKH